MPAQARGRSPAREPARAAHTPVHPCASPRQGDSKESSVGWDPTFNSYPEKLPATLSHSSAVHRQDPVPTIYTVS